eukprot:m.303846 g.303846  ORF g.303846 m.303846 type:complete len:1167 (+) comp55258_c0_seq2:30-3530(+)
MAEAKDEVQSVDTSTSSLTDSYAVFDSHQEVFLDPQGVLRPLALQAGSSESDDVIVFVPGKRANIPSAIREDDEQFAEASHKAASQPHLSQQAKLPRSPHAPQQQQPSRVGLPKLARKPSADSDQEGQRPKLSLRKLSLTTIPQSTSTSPSPSIAPVPTIRAPLPSIGQASAAPNLKQDHSTRLLTAARKLYMSSLASTEVDLDGAVVNTQPGCVLVLCSDTALQEQPVVLNANEANATLSVLNSDLSVHDFAAPTIVDVCTAANPLRVLFDSQISSLVPNLLEGHKLIVSLAGYQFHSGSSQSVRGYYLLEMILLQVLQLVESTASMGSMFLIKTWSVAKSRSLVYDLHKRESAPSPISSFLHAKKVEASEFIVATPGSLHTWTTEISKSLEHVAKSSAVEEALYVATIEVAICHADGTKSFLCSEVQLVDLPDLLIDHLHGSPALFSLLNVVSVRPSTTGEYLEENSLLEFSLPAGLPVNCFSLHLLHAEEHIPNAAFVHDCCQALQAVRRSRVQSRPRVMKEEHSRLAKYLTELLSLEDVVLEELSEQRRSQLRARQATLQTRILVGTQAQAHRNKALPPLVRSLQAPDIHLSSSSINTAVPGDIEHHLTATPDGRSLEPQRPKLDPFLTHDLAVGLTTIPAASGFDDVLVASGETISTWLQQSVLSLEHVASCRTFAQQLLDARWIVALQGDATHLFVDNKDALYAINGDAPRATERAVRLQSSSNAHVTASQNAAAASVDYSTEGIFAFAMNGGCSYKQLQEMVRLAGVDCVDAAGRTPLMYAIIGEQIKMVEWLLKLNAGVNVVDNTGQTPLLWVAAKGNDKLMKTLLKSGADVSYSDFDKRTAFHWCSKLDNPKCLKLLSFCADDHIVNQQDVEHLSPLHWAVLGNKPEHASILLSTLRADASVKDGEGRTPLIYAVVSHAFDCVKLLIKHCNADIVNLKDNNGRTALHRACGEGATESVMDLVASGKCNLDCQDDRQATPLHWATVTNRPQLIRYLLDKGAKPLVCDSQGRTALQFALQMNFHECVKVLKLHTSQLMARGAWSELASTGTSIGGSLPSVVPSARDLDATSTVSQRPTTLAPSSEQSSSQSPVASALQQSPTRSTSQASAQLPSLSPATHSRTSLPSPPTGRVPIGTSRARRSTGGCFLFCGASNDVVE